ncbi:hypothetical protein ACQKJC_08755 [Priestia koreensis]|uniref:hypothetical protein n=1 Tax=Priestia koreensis TaxID=284581 RepID=UPI003D07089E
MPEIKFNGFSKYHSRNVCSVTFNTAHERISFEAKFNMQFRSPQIVAEQDNNNSLNVNIAYTNDVSDEYIEFIINQIR